MESQQRIEQIVVIALLILLAVGCLAVLRPFLSALLRAMILSFSSWPLHAWLVRRLWAAHLAHEPPSTPRGSSGCPQPCRRGDPWPREVVLRS